MVKKVIKRAFYQQRDPHGFDEIPSKRGYIIFRLFNNQIKVLSSYGFFYPMIEFKGDKKPMIFTSIPDAQRFIRRLRKDDAKRSYQYSNFVELPIGSEKYKIVQYNDDLLEVFAKGKYYTDLMKYDTWKPLLFDGEDDMFGGNYGRLKKAFKTDDSLISKKDVIVIRKRKSKPSKVKRFKCKCKK